MNADPDLQDSKGWSALMFSVKELHEIIVDELINKGANVNQKNENDESSLIIISKLKKPEVQDEQWEKKFMKVANTLLFASD